MVRFIRSALAKSMRFGVIISSGAPPGRSSPQMGWTQRQARPAEPPTPRSEALASWTSHRGIGSIAASLLPRESAPTTLGGRHSGQAPPREHHLITTSTTSPSHPPGQQRQRVRCLLILSSDGVAPSWSASVLALAFEPHNAPGAATAKRRS
jgi:hypothetical protein